MSNLPTGYHNAQVPETNWNRSGPYHSNLYNLVNKMSDNYLELENPKHFAMMNY